MVSNLDEIIYIASELVFVEVATADDEPQASCKTKRCGKLCYDVLVFIVLACSGSRRFRPISGINVLRQGTLSL